MDGGGMGVRWVSVFVSSALALASIRSYSQAANEEGDASSPATVVVSGTRITAAGFNAPTPTTMVTTDELQQVAQPKWKRSARLA